MQSYSDYRPSPVITKSGNLPYSMRENAGTENSRVQKKLPLGLGPTFPRFRSQDIPDECLAAVINVACQAGTEGNLQPTRWIVVRSEAAKRHLEAAISIEVPLTSAPVILICLADALAWKLAPQRLQEMVATGKITEERGREVLRQLQQHYSSSPDIAHRTALANGLEAVQQVLLSAGSFDLSAFWVTEFDEAPIKTHFHIPDHFIVAALVPMGYTEETPANVPQSSPQRLIYQEKFGKVLNP